MVEEVKINFSEIEKKWQNEWEKSKIFEVSEDSKKKKFYNLEMFPYPSGSGLHMGHALNNTLQDIIIRFRRMRNFNTLWVPGTDHGGIATQNVVEKLLLAEGKKRADLGRDKFVERMWQWRKVSKVWRKAKVQPTHYTSLM